MFSSSTPAPHAFETTARYTCVSGFGLNGGDMIRTCERDGSSPTGRWSGGAPRCTGEKIIVFSK